MSVSKTSIIESVTRKSMIIRESGRSTDYISPSFGYGCLYDCTYCYMKRNKARGLTIATNIGDILTAVDHHSWFATVEKPNQTHDEFVTYDISCNEDIALHAKYYPMDRILSFFRDHPRAFGSFATKYVNPDLLQYNPGRKVRIRFSLMPQKFSEILEPKTSSIQDRIIAINQFIDAGYDVHINFSPVIVTDNWLEEYGKLFQLVDSLVYDKYKDRVKAEVIFLTHNENKHQYNLYQEYPGEDLIWQPEIQESKTSEFGGENIRYRRDLKSLYIQDFKLLHESIIPWNFIRYIF